VLGQSRVSLTPCWVVDEQRPSGLSRHRSVQHLLSVTSAAAPVVRPPRVVGRSNHGDSNVEVKRRPADALLKRVFVKGDTVMATEENKILVRRFYEEIDKGRV
jgi:hypothetical protein